MKERIEKVLEEDVRPALASHGGSVELVEVGPDQTATVRLTGACGGCAYAQMTLLKVVKARLMAKIPELKDVRT